MASSFDSITVSGSLSINESGISAQSRLTILKQDANAIFPIPMTSLRVWDAFATNLPATAATDDLSLVGGTFGTAPPTISAGDCKALGATTRYARLLTQLPECYESGQTVTIAISAGMKTTVASASCTVDVECYKIDKITGIGVDLCATAAITINSLVFGSKEFIITPSSLAAGDVFDIRIAIACNDAATGTAVTPTIASIDLLADIKG